MTQVVPIEGARPSKRTEVRIVTDEDALYIGVRCYDEDADGIIARNMLRDGQLRAEDRVGFILDTFHDRRNAFFFQTNALGARIDALVEDTRFLLNWDGIWNVKTRIDSEGWTAEFVIPFKTLNFREGSSDWGFNVLRGIRGTQERLHWTDAYQNKRFTDPAHAGILRGMSKARQGLGLDVVPSLTVTHVADGDALPVEEQRHYTRTTPSGDLRYKITPSLTATGTVNTSFGQTPVDDVQVNLSRFALFFPEKREFFLQDQGIFDFGNVGQDAQPFFSRRIGFDGNGEEVPIRGGGKLTGRIGPLNVGALVVHQSKQQHEGSDSDVPTKTLGVARLKLNVGEESTVGVVGTYGDPQSDDENWLIGTDFNYRTSELYGDQVLEAGAWFQKSRTPHGDGHQCTDEDDRGRDCDSENAYGIRMANPNDRVSWQFVVQRIEEDFNPKLGFLRREDIVRYRGSWRYRWRPETWIQTIDTNTFAFVGTESDRPDHVTEAFIRENFADVETTVGDRFFSYLQVEFQDEPDERIVFDNVALPGGKHVFPTAGVAFEATRSRPVSGRVEVFGGEYYDGWRVGVHSALRWEPIRQLLFSVSYRHTRHWDLHRLPDDSICKTDPADDFDTSGCGDSFTVRIASARVEVQISPDLTWNNLVQYDNGSDEMNLQSIMRWTITPGSDLFVVFNQGFFVEHNEVRAGRTQPLVKLGWTFRF
jgi:hypothetical protein